MWYELILNKIEAVASNQWKDGPECNFSGKKGKVIYQKSFGYQTYDKKSKVANTDVTLLL
jgi:hypothetical protein